jgi:hypothetical protein
VVLYFFTISTRRFCERPRLVLRTVSFK